MRMDVLTIFPAMFDGFLGESLVAKGIEKGLMTVNVRNIRDFTENKHGKVDDAPFGGGAGMVMTPQPLADAIDSLRKKSPARTILLSPRGKQFTQRMARELSLEKRLILVCGRYEGVDERIARHWVDEELSVGDFVLNGGEVAAMAVIEAIFRLLPGALGCGDSRREESFEEGLLEYPQYTRPENFRGHAVPQELLSGHHKQIREWRRNESMKKTAETRPDLLEKRHAAAKINFSIALVHYPVAGKDGSEMVSSITTLDAHDFARLGKTYGANRTYMVTPVDEQRRLVERIIKHWKEDDSLRRIDGRKSLAVEILRTAFSIDEMIADAMGRSKRVRLLATSAGKTPGSVQPGVWRTMAAERAEEEWIILFGTAYGLGKSLMARADCVLSPVEGAGEFNHLPVRCASAIILDRLFGRSVQPGEELI